MNRTVRVLLSIAACIALYMAGAGDVPYPSLVATLAVALVGYLTWR